MRIEVSNRGEDGILSFKAENQAEHLQLAWILEKSKSLHLEAFDFSGWDDDVGGISFVIKVLPVSSPEKAPSVSREKQEKNKMDWPLNP